jgi:hypothetical protein
MYTITKTGWDESTTRTVANIVLIQQNLYAIRRRRRSAVYKGNIETLRF